MANKATILSPLSRSPASTCLLSQKQTCSFHIVSILRQLVEQLWFNALFCEAAVITPARLSEISMELAQNV